MIFPRIVLDTHSTDSNALTALIAPIAVVAVIVAWRFGRGKRTPAAAKNSAAFVCPTHPVIHPRPGAPAPSRPLSPIESVRQLMGPPFRAFDPRLMSYLTFAAPKWLEKNRQDEQWLNVQNQQRLRRDGPIVWARIVQANNNLFKKNNAESGASVIYSPDLWFDRNRSALTVIASQCFALKGTDPSDPESAAFARMLTNEMTRGMRMKVPSVFTAGREVLHSAILLPRKHMPKGFLAGSFFPIWIDPENTGSVVMVPAAYWPPTLTSEWDQS